MDKYILSISVPTFNRKAELKELVENLLSLKNGKLQVVITDNKSTDGTREYLKTIKDNRLKVCFNNEAVPGYYNMILGLFNADGKYVIHCNDRDYIDISKIEKLIDFLERNDFSFIQTSRTYGMKTNKVEIFDKGFDSLINQNYSSHPTGMIFNVGLMKANLNPKDYLKYVDDTFTYSFLMRELVRFEKSAKYDIGCWNERNSKIKLKLKSGSVYKGGLYFEPDRICAFMKSVVRHILDQDKFELTLEEKEKLVINIIDYFKRQLILKKMCYSDKRECAHYGIKKRHVSYLEMKKIYRMYIKECEECLIEIGYIDKLKEKWLEKKKEYIHGLVKDCIKADKGILYRNLKRVISVDYPY